MSPTDEKNAELHDKIGAGGFFLNASASITVLGLSVRCEKFITASAWYVFFSRL